MRLPSTGRHMARVGPLCVALFLALVAMGSLAAKAAAADADAPSFEQVPLFELAGTAGWRASLKVSPTTTADDVGLTATGDIRTVASDFVRHDFVFDVVYVNKPGEQSIFN